jgi:uncharacterized protein (DUF2235 family)
MKRIVICADGTWNRPEEDLEKDFPTNVLKLARAIKPKDKDVPQQVFYDWGIGSHHDRVIGGATGRGLHKNIMDNYRYLVQNYSPGDEIYLFGFSRGSYTIRCLCGLINNCGILKRSSAQLIQKAFEHYKKSGPKYAPAGEKSREFRKNFSHSSRKIKFVGVWDTVGAMGIPISFLGLFEDKDEFYDTKIGSNVAVARHAMAIDEHRKDFEPTIWVPRPEVDIKQVWFVGAHADIGGSYKPDSDGTLLSDFPFFWLLDESRKIGLKIEPHLIHALNPSYNATLHISRRSFYRIKQSYYRKIEHGKGRVFIHESVKDRWDMDKNYRPKNLQDYLGPQEKWPIPLVKL